MASYTPEMLTAALKAAPAKLRKMTNEQLAARAMTDLADSAMAAAELQRRHGGSHDLFNLFGVKTWER
jgi:hypothetical protein